MVRRKYKLTLLSVFLPILITLIAALGGVFVCKTQSALADGPGTFSAEDLEITQITDGYEIVYGGETVPLQIRFNYDVTANYTWYKKDTPTGTAAVVIEGRSGVPTVYPVAVKDSGYYYCQISSVSYGGKTYWVNLVSDTVYVKITPKPIEVTVGKTELVYNGEWQTPVLTVNKDGVKHGDEVSAYLDTTIPIKDRGTYYTILKLDNDNYSVTGNTEVVVTILRTPLTIKIKQVNCKAGNEYDLELEYIGFQGRDNENSLGFKPTIPSIYRNKTTPGLYTMRPTGQDESNNYTITYEDSQLNINLWKLTDDRITGADATASGSFRANTVMSLTDGRHSVQGFSLLKVVKYKYEVKFVSGGSDDETYTVNLEDESISKFMLAVCCEEDGVVKGVRNFKYNDGVLSVVLPSSADKSMTIVIYNDYTVIVILGAVFFLAFLIMIFVKIKSREKFRVHSECYKEAVLQSRRMNYKVAKMREAEAEKGKRKHRRIIYDGKTYEI